MLPFLPLLLVFALLLLGRGPIVACGSGIAAIALLAAMTGASVPLATMPPAAARTAILAMSAAVVIFAGQYLNLLLQRNGTIAELSRRIEALPMDKSLKTLLIVLGVAPAVESLTGFGVSLFLCVPLLLSLYPPHQAARVALLGMNIMPWGTLGLATLVGAGLAQLAPQTLGVHTALTSALVFPTIGVLTALVIDRSARVIGIALTLGALLAAQLVLYNHILSVELAGVLAGLGTAATGALGCGALSKTAGGAARAGWMKAVRPYVILLALIALARGSYPWWSEFSAAVALVGGGNDGDGEVRFEWMTSPAVFLAATALYVRHADSLRVRFAEVWAKSARPVISIALFLLLAQAMQVSGLLGGMVDALLGVAGARGHWLSPALGMLSGYITGSNLGANALMMSVQSQLGAQFGDAALFSAIQNSGGGHAVFASLPIIVLVASIAKGMRVELDEAKMIRFAMLCLIPIYFAIVAAAMMLDATTLDALPRGG
ncbi:MAG: L-lactate permease [bacterium]